MYFMNKPIPWYIIVLLSLVLWGGEYVRRDLWEPDEARFALVSREMREGHWLVPFRQGEFYSHKPPLMFWLTNVFSIVTGGEIGNVAPRLPSFLGAVMALWAVSRLAALWFSARASWYTVLILASSFLFWNKGGFGQIDMLLCGLEMMALYFLFSANRAPAIAPIAIGYLFMGLAILAKGPVGFLVPLGVYLLGSRAAGEKLALPKIQWWFGPVIALSVPGLWLLAALIQGTPDGFFAELLLKQNIGRVAGEFGGHQKPFYYFLYYFPLDFLPWTFLLPMSYAALKRAPEWCRERRRLIAWMVFVIFFFSLSVSKRNLYILPVYPAAAMLIAAGIDQWGQLSYRWIRNSFWSIWGLLALLGVALTIASFIYELPLNALMLLPGGLIMLAGCWWVYDSWHLAPREPRWLGAMSVVILATFASIGALVYPEFDAFKTPAELVSTAQSLLKPDERIIMYKQHGEIFSLYTGRKGYMAFSPDELRAFIRDTPQDHHLIVALAREADEIRSVIGPNHPSGFFEMGNKKLVWIDVSNQLNGITPPAK